MPSLTTNSAVVLPPSQPISPPTTGEQSRKRKRAPSEPDTSIQPESHTLPLTRENLILVTGEMPTAGASEKSKARQTQTSGTQGADIEDILKFSGMPVRDEEVQRSSDFQPIKDLTERLLAPRRDSPEIAGRDHDHWQAKLKVYKKRNERTFMTHFFNPLTSGARNVISESCQTVQREWQEDGLDFNEDQPFLTGSINRIFTGGNKEWHRKLNSLPRVKNPKPDTAYGYAIDSLTTQEQDVCRANSMYTCISKGIRLPAIINEFGQTDHPRAIAQAARGGAAIVNATRELVKRSGKDIMSPGPDVDTVAFSFPYTYNLAHLYVHWALVRDGKVTYHMHRRRFYDIDPDSDGIFQQRRDLNNLLEWMLFDRRKWVGVLLADLNRAGSPQLPPTLPVEDAVDDARPDEGSASYVGMWFR